MGSNEETAAWHRHCAEEIAASFRTLGVDRYFGVDEIAAKIAAHQPPASASSLEGDGLAKLRAWAESAADEGSEGDWTYVPWDDLNGSPGLRSMLDRLAAASPGEAEERAALILQFERAVASVAVLEQVDLDTWRDGERGRDHAQRLAEQRAERDRLRALVLAAPAPGEAREGERVRLWRVGAGGIWSVMHADAEELVRDNPGVCETRWATLDPAPSKEDR